VSATEKMVNAAMLFNTKTFQPEFRIHVGRPGASHALNLARQLNLPSEVLNHAETILDSDQLRLESMLANLEEDQRQFYQDVEQLRIDKERTSQAKKEAETQLSQLRKERKKIMHEAYQEASKMTQRTHKEMQKVLKKLSTDNVAEVRKELHEKQHKIDKGLKTTEAKPEAPISINTLKEGMTVWVEKLQARAKVTFINLNNKKVKLDLDGLPVEVPVKQIGKIINDKAQPQNPRKGPLKTSRPRAAKSSQEINLIGLRVHQALNKLERFIDQSLLSNTSEVRIVHGFGTGRLRESIHEYLNRLNLSYRDGEKEEGGGGATVVTL
jgi:DNA mismatch repair protein MutS2